MAKLIKGEKFPNFTFQTECQQNLHTDDVVKDADKTIFWVLRYIGCTTCRYDVHQISQRYDEFKAKGAQVYVVMQSEPANVRHDMEGYPMPFHIICDTEQEIYKTLNIEATRTKEERQPTKEEDKARQAAKSARAKALFTHGLYEGNEQQLPAMFIVDKNAKVEYAHYATNAIDMPTIDETLSILDTLKK